MAASIKPFQRLKDGRGAYLAIRAQYAGRDKWETEIKRQDNLLHTRVWKGQGIFSLERFVAQHRNAFVSSFQLPNQHTRVGYLLDAIQTSDAGLQAAMAQVNSDDANPNGKRNNFEAAVAYLLPYDPVAKKRNQATKRTADEANVGDVTADVGATDAGFGTKPGLGKTGVHLRYYEEAEYKKLPKAQQEELRQWRIEQRKKGVSFGKKGKRDSKKYGSNGGGGLSKKEVASVVSEEMKKLLHDEEEVDALISALGSNQASESAGSSKKVRINEPQMTVNRSALRSILRRVKNPPSASTTDKE